jgi:hypothetical protein
MSNILSQAPMIGAEGLRSLAQTGGQLGIGSGQLGLGAGQTAANIGLQGEGLGLDRGRLGIEQQRVDLQRRGQNIGIAGTIGTGIADILGSTGLGSKIGKGISGLFGGGPERAPASVSQPPASSMTPPAPTAAPYIPPPPVVPGPVTNQYNAAYDSALKLKKPLNQLAR